MSDKQLSVAFIGAGRIAGGYDADRTEGEAGIFSHAGAYTSAGGFSLNSVFDTNPAAVAAFKDYWKVGAVAANIDDILNVYHDIVSVCTPDHTHFDVICQLVKAKCCKTIFAEKPLALTRDDITTLQAMSDANGINVVVNFQRRFDPLYADLAAELAADPKRIITANAMYMKGFEHVGVTMLDTLDALFGPPGSVAVFNTVMNREINEPTYEFILYYDGFNITVKTVDSPNHVYNYHIFDIDIFLTDGRLTLNQIGRSMVHRKVGGYVYSGVKILDEAAPRVEKTGLDNAMLQAVEYVARITRGAAHTINTPAQVLRIRYTMDAITRSAETKTKIEVNKAS